MTNVPHGEVGYHKKRNDRRGAEGSHIHTDNGILRKPYIATNMQLIIDRLLVLHWAAVELLVHERHHWDRTILSEKTLPNTQLIIRFELGNRTEEVSTFSSWTGLKKEGLCVLYIVLSHLFWTSDLWTHQPRSHRTSPPSICGACLNF